MADITYRTGHAELRRARWASSLNVLAGIWLVIAPFILGFTSSASAMWNSIAVGAVVVVLAAIRAFNPDEREGISWVNVVLGLWMVVSPYVLNYTNVSSAQTNALITGVIILALAAFSAYETNEAHRGAGGTSDSDVT
ncbi:MAG: SPW repeat protein [Coriobacteriia bacterium]